MWRVFWKANLTGLKGHGGSLPYETALVWAAYANDKHADVFHWIEYIMD